ncbi:thioesterase domain-containing protein, partial [Streptomyces glaucescens]|uniref:thioesterase domain-containing protein n=1 Tax=Streptomyces glaucescens TaxID=1907 RepID=UPI001180B756
ERGRLLAGTAPGAMLAVPLPEDRVRERLGRHGLDLAAVNDATSCVVSGPAEAVDALTAELAAEGVTGRRLAVSHAFHSRLLDPVLDRFTAVLEGVRLQAPGLPFVSDLTGGWADPDEVRRPAYWREHLRRTVRFHDGLSTLYGDARLRDAVLLEVGPGRALGRAARRHPGRDGRLVVAAMPPAGDAAHEEPATALHALGTAWAAGADVDAEAFHGLTTGDRVLLPGYAFARQEHWIDRTAPVGGPALPNPTVPAAASPAAPHPTATEASSDRAPDQASDRGAGHGPDQAPDEAAATVAEAWRTVLGVDTIRPDDDFFAQGGDSLAAVQLVARIRARTGADIEFMALKRHTPQALTRALTRRLAGGRPEEDMPRGLVVIRTGDPQARPPLVLVHPIGGDVFFYRELAACLPKDQAVYAIRSPLLDGTADLDTIEDMAASYLERLEEFGLKPPYRLGGSSFGGLVAYEMARQLDARDAHRPQVVLIDSPAPGNLPAEMTDDDILDYLMRYGLARLDLPRADLAALPATEDRIRLIADRARGTEFEALLSADFLPRYLRAWQRHSRAMHAYTARPYAGDVLFFSHQEEIPEFPAGQAPHWRRLVRGAFRDVPVPGNHLSMNGMPHVATIGAHLAQGDNGE